MKSFSKKIKEQTLLAIKLLEKASPLIKYKPLVTVSEDEIEAYLKWSKKSFPPDFHYWLTNYGSGRIQFIESGVSIPSIGDILINERDGRSYRDNDPAECWNRIYLDYAGTPAVRALDSTIADESGCTPVIETYSYSDKVLSVYSSSWPMYIISQIISAAKQTYSSMNQDTGSIGETAEHFSSIYYPSFDRDLENAHKKAMEHNKTKYAEGKKNPYDISETIIKSLSFIDKKLALGKKTEKLRQVNIEKDFQNIKSQIPSYIPSDVVYKEPASIDEAVKMTEEKISKGSSIYPHKEYEFIEKSTEKSHINKLLKLAEHPSYEIRKAAIKGLERLKPKDINLRTSRQ